MSHLSDFCEALRSGPGVFVALSCGPAQIAAPFTLPITGLIALVQKIRALVAENSEEYLNHDHSPKFDKQCRNQVCIKHDIEHLYESANVSFELFLLNVLCLIPFMGGILADMYFTHIVAEEQRIPLI